MSEKLLEAIAGAPDRPLKIGDSEIPCYVLEDETRVLSQGQFLVAIGRSRTPKAGTGGFSGMDDLPTFLSAENLSRFVSDELRNACTPIQFRLDSGQMAVGYRAELLPQICEVYLDARTQGVLLPQQQHIASRAEVLVRALATVGIIALVDEATGYQAIREKRALASILEKFIAKELQPWTRTFPYEFYEQIYRLKGWGVPSGPNRPQVIGHYTNDIVYERIAPGVLHELRLQNPMMPSGNRANRHHQWFTPEYGHPRLKEHLTAVIALMRVATTWDGFLHSLDIAYPKLNANLALPLESQ